MNAQAFRTLHVLRDHTVSQRDRAQAALQQALQLEQAAQQQLEQLQSYQHEQDLRWREQFSQGGAIDTLRQAQHFGQRLSTAIAMQQRTVAQRAQQTARARQHLVQCELDLASVDALIAGRQQTALRAETRRDQRINDELAARSRSLWGTPDPEDTP